jgi:hypothetical protein
MNGGQEIFQINNNNKHKAAIEKSVLKTHEHLLELQQLHKDAFRDNRDSDDSTIFSDEFDEPFGKYEHHWSIDINKHMIRDWITAISSCGIFYLGCKHPDLNCYCPFQKRFKAFLQSINILSYVTNNDNNGCCKNTRYGTKWNPKSFINHCSMNNTNEQTKWYHMMVLVYVCEMFDIPYPTKRGHKKRRIQPPFASISIRK